MYTTKYEQFIYEMEKNGFRAVRSVIDEFYANLSDNDDIISITARDCEMITIKGIKESTTENGIVTGSHNIYMKIYDTNGRELEDNDTIQLIVTNLMRTGLPTTNNKENKGEHSCVYYNYPYRSVSSKNGVRLKKGISITKDKKLDIVAIRKSTPLKIWKFEMKIECDKWSKTNDGSKLTGSFSETDDIHMEESIEYQNDYQ